MVHGELVHPRESTLKRVSVYHAKKKNGDGAFFGVGGTHEEHAAAAYAIEDDGRRRLGGGGLAVALDAHEIHAMGR